MFLVLVYSQSQPWLAGCEEQMQKVEKIWDFLESPSKIAKQNKEKLIFYAVSLDVWLCC